MFAEFSSEPIWARGFLCGKVFSHRVHFFSGCRTTQAADFLLSELGYFVSFDTVLSCFQGRGHLTHQERGFF